jgi:hypothetical protein
MTICYECISGHSFMVCQTVLQSRACRTACLKEVQTIYVAWLHGGLGTRKKGPPDAR